MNIHPTVIALGGNALVGEDSMVDFPRLRPACRVMAGHVDNGLVVTHGNGPQIGLLAQNTDQASARPMDVLGAETEGLLGYCIEQELANNLPQGHRAATLLTRVEVDADDSAFDHPAKPIGAWLEPDEAERLRKESGWRFIEKDGRCRRVVPSPSPRRVLQVDAIRTLLNDRTAVICAGGGGIPVVRQDDGMHGVEAVIDKDRASSLLAQQLDAARLVLATDVDGVYRDWDGERQDRIERATPEALLDLALPEGSMGPKVEAACAFVQATGRPAVIGALQDLEALLDGRAGTVITPKA